MNIICSSNMPYAKEAFSTLGEATLLNGREIGADDVKGAEILAIRSTTKAGPELLDGSSVKFVGTATIGTDHLDLSYFEANGITWCYAPGCNANSVSEYVTAALLCLGQRHGLTIEGKTIGVIGVGNVGSLVVKKAKALGMRVLQNDPPRQRNEEDSEDFVELDQVLAESDIITMHVPLEKGGEDPTWQMVNAEFFEKARNDCIFLNAARGGIMDTDALLGAINSGKVSHCILDTWEGEPSIRTDILERADIGTPHIAGHSFEGKVMGTVMVYEEACKFLGVDADWKVDALLPEPLVPEVSVNAEGRSDEEVLWEIVRQVYDIENDDGVLRASPVGFDAQRSNYPIRREFRFTRVCLQGASEKLLTKVRELGFS
jgi:erythronate-4-phosphate dehydrogenase